MMVITRPVPKVAFLLSLINDNGYHTVFPFPFDSPDSTDPKCLWEYSLLAVADSQPLEEVKSCVWVCSMCNRLSGTCFDEFITHLSSREHVDRIPIFSARLEQIPMEEYREKYSTDNYFLEAAMIKEYEEEDEDATTIA
ncbi:PREDICTED: uncharacterized protein LOC104768785 isoform X2 [Camelina sativa]|uniref:Uncharacterized protein LOC104768785 isoform X2 n=1 Tax=Camelina sativa TaxID=90675 RepID=A0ABM0XUC5_CAMSA|nr:PREDICTED: uncharacterized protein LOC104768785 isoform X2 [Camelina sativa]